MKPVRDRWGAWRGLPTGTKDESRWPENADAAFDQVPIPPGPIEGDFGALEGGGGSVLPWWDASENPYAPTGFYASMDPTYPYEDRGGLPIVGAYEPAVRTVGPARPWGYEVGGGLGGDQALGRIMRFPANVPMRDDPYDEGVWLGDVHDELSIAVANNSQDQVTEEAYTASLLGHWTGGQY